jgi:hypothetical protein
MRIRTLLPIAALAALLLAIAAPAAGAKPRDRNHDGIPDRWERSHRLSLKVNQARRDQDRDGLRNRAEYRSQTDPRDDDSDGDGISDGDEQAGKVAAYAPDTGVLTIDLFGGGSITGKVTGDTEIECDSGGDGAAKEERGFRHDDEGDDEHGDEDEHGDDEHGDERDCDACAPGALKEGAIVQEAELELDGRGAVFKKIELVG